MLKLPHVDVARSAKNQYGDGDLNGQDKQAAFLRLEFHDLVSAGARAGHLFELLQRAPEPTSRRIPTP